LSRPPAPFPKIVSSQKGSKMDRHQMKIYVLVKTDNEQEESLLLEEEEVEALGGISCDGRICRRRPWFPLPS
jgi:hypothetical protein